MTPKKTGSCYLHDEEGKLFLATSYQDDEGLTWTESEEVETN